MPIYRTKCLFSTKKNVKDITNFTIASSDFFLRYEPVEEVFRERTQHYRREKKSTDFWFLSSPGFLESSQSSYLIAINSITPAIINKIA